MSGDEVKKKLSENGYKLVDIATFLGIIPQNLHSLLKSDDVKTGVLEKIALAINKDICFFFESGANSVTGNQSIAGHGNTISGNVNVTLPEKGYQKIIKSDGSQTIVEVASAGYEGDPASLAAENAALREENKELLNKVIRLQDRLLDGN